MSALPACPHVHNWHPCAYPPACQFTVDKTLGTLEPQQTMVVQVTANLNDVGRFSDTLNVVVRDAPQVRRHPILPLSDRVAGEGRGKRRR